MTILHKIFFLSAVCSAVTGALTSCIEDSFTSSASDQPYFSTDTVRMGELFTLDASPTHRFVVYNRHDKGLNISSIEFADDPQGIFRLNVDGMSGRRFDNVEIRPNDSIFVFVEATLPENGRDVPVDVLSHIEFRCNGVASRLPVKAFGRDVIRFSGDTRFNGSASLGAGKPYHITDSIVVEEGATLTIPAGAELYFHSEARMVVHGTLRVEGTSDAPVSFTGDRSGYVASTIPYEIMSGQWGGIEFTPTSCDNYISHASIRNTEYGIVVDGAQGAPALMLVNSQVRNSKGYVLAAVHTSVTAAGCELAEASSGIVALVGGNHIFNQCTIANYYLFSALGGPAVQMWHVTADDADVDDSGQPLDLPYLSADFSNCIIYGNGTDISHGDLEGTEVTLRRCLLKSNGEDDSNFIDCLWGEDPLYNTVREEYIFDYTLKDDSPAIDAAYPDLVMPETATDRYGNPRLPSPSLGAYQRGRVE